MSFFQDWMAHTQHLPTSEIYRTWGAVFCTSAALTRRVHIRTNLSMPPIYPNLYVMFVSPPGTGKDMAIDRIAELLSSVKFEAPPGYGLNLAEESISAKGLVDSLAAEDSVLSMRKQSAKGVEIESFHSLILCVPELGTMLSEYNPALISNLNELYNCRSSFRDRVRSGALKGVATEIRKPHVAMILGTQPETLNKTFPEEAFKMGFFSRTILVAEKTLNRKPLFDVNLTPDYNRLGPMTDYLLSLTKLVGTFKISSDCAKAADYFHMEECDETAVSHYKLEDYNTRRFLHLLKLSMIFSAMESTEMVVTENHWLQAKDLLFQTEKRMPALFSELISSRGFFGSLEELAILTAEKGVAKESTLRRYLTRQHPVYEVRQILDEALATGHLRVVSTDKNGQRTFAPGVQHDQLRVIPGGKRN